MVIGIWLQGNLNLYCMPTVIILISGFASQFVPFGGMSPISSKYFLEIHRVFFFNLWFSWFEVGAPREPSLPTGWKQNKQVPLLQDFSSF